MRCVSSRSAPRSPRTTSTGQRIRDHSSHQPRPLASVSAARSTSCSKLGHSPSSRASSPPIPPATTTCRHQRRQAHRCGEGEGHEGQDSSQRRTVSGALGSAAGLASTTTRARTNSGRLAASRRTIKPPNDCPTTTAGARSSCSIHSSTSATKASARRSPVRARFVQKPRCSTATTLKVSDSPGCGLVPLLRHTRRARATVQRPGRDRRDPGSTAESPHAPRRASARPPRRGYSLVSERAGRELRAMTDRPDPCLARGALRMAAHPERLRRPGPRGRRAALRGVGLRVRPRGRRRGRARRDRDTSARGR